MMTFQFEFSILFSVGANTGFSSLRKLVGPCGLDAIKAERVCGISLRNTARHFGAVDS